MEPGRRMESIAELRRKVQEPVRRYNDIAGLLVGDRVSIHVTRLFLAFGISPTVATISMLVLGVAGSVLATFGGALSVVGFGLVFAYYICDCVDGEVARYHRGEKLIWGFWDFLFHLAVKSAFFVSVGIYAASFTGKPWVFFFGLSALLAVLFQKFLHDLTLILTCRYVLLRDAETRDRFARQLAEGIASEHLDTEVDAAEPDPPSATGGLLPTLRAMLTNFDLASLVFLAASVADLLAPPFDLFDLVVDMKVVVVLFYGVVLPVDFVDRLLAHARDRRFRVESQQLLRKAHHFRLK